MSDYGNALIEWLRTIANEIDDPVSDLAHLRADKLREAADHIEWQQSKLEEG